MISTEQFAKWVEERTLDGFDIFFTSNALTGEIGELANVIKKEEFYNRFEKFHNTINERILAGTTTPYINQFIDEGGDALFYLVQLFNKRGVSIQQVMEYQMQKMELQTIENNDKVYKK